MKKKKKKKKITICEIDLKNQKPVDPPEVVGWYFINTKEFKYPAYPYGVGKEWQIGDKSNE